MKIGVVHGPASSVVASFSQSWLPLFPVFHVIVSAFWLSTVSFRINTHRSPQPSLGLWQSFSFFGLFVVVVLPPSSPVSSVSCERVTSFLTMCCLVFCLFVGWA